MYWATVPEATVHEHCDTGALEEYVRSSGEARNYPLMSTESKAEAMEVRAQFEF